MFITIINDCRDENARGRQTSRVSSLTGQPVNFIGIRNDLEASGNLIDILDATEGRVGAILVNVAPRNGSAKKWPNGTPFGYFYHRDTLVISSIGGLTLSLIKKLNLAQNLTLLDIKTTTEILVTENYLEPELTEGIVTTQFRSFNFLPRIAQYLLASKEIPGEKLTFDEISEAPKTIWWIDNFGNCKTTLLKSDLKIGNQKVKTIWGEIPFYQTLSQVKDGEIALIVGSSGLADQRFIEIVKQGGDASQDLKLEVGQIFETKPRLANR